MRNYEWFKKHLYWNWYFWHRCSRQETRSFYHRIHQESYQFWFAWLREINRIINRRRTTRNEKCKPGKRGRTGARS